MPSAPDLPEHSATGLLGLQEAADQLGVHYMTAYRYVRTGRLPARRVGNQCWVDPNDLPAAAAGSAVVGRSRTETRRASRVATARRLEDRLVAGGEPGGWGGVGGGGGPGA